MKKYFVTLTEEEHTKLSQIVRKGSHKSQKVLNALILLNCDTGEHQDGKMKNEDVSKVFASNLYTVQNYTGVNGHESLLEQNKQYICWTHACHTY